MTQAVSIDDVNSAYSSELSLLNSAKSNLADLKKSLTVLSNHESFKDLIDRLEHEINHHKMPEKKVFSGSLDKEKIQKMWDALELKEVAIPETLRNFYVKDFENNMDKLGIAVVGIQVFVAEKTHVDKEDGLFEAIYRSVVICANGVFGVNFQVYYSVDSDDCRFNEDLDKTSDLITSPQSFENKYSLMNQDLESEFNFHENFEGTVAKYVGEDKDYAFRYIDLMEM